MICLRVKSFSSLKDRTRGLIGRKNPESVMFLTRFGIHTFGLMFPLDVVILDGTDRAVKLEENLKPNKFFFWPVKYNKVLELPIGFIKKRKINVGCKIKLIKA